MRRPITVAAVIAVAVLLTACAGPERGQRHTPVPAVIVIRAQRGEAVRSITLPGDLVGFYEATLYAKVTGYLASIGVDKGDWVKAGQTLAQIEVPELKHQLARARANLEINRLTYQRLEKVWKEDPRLVAREDVDVAFSKFREADARVGELEAMVAYTKIVAPFDGVITGRFADPGTLIKAASVQSAVPSETSGGAATATSPVLTEAMIDKLRIYVYVPQDNVPFIRRGTPASVTLADLPGRSFTGSVTRFAMRLDLSTRTMLTEVDLENPRHELYPGMYANVDLELERHRNALKLPLSALGTSPDGLSHYVYVAKGDRLRRVPVTIGINTGTYVEITSGLGGEELVASTINPSLADGEQVRPVSEQGEGGTNAVTRTDLP
jgi:membrane fusion protein (multidrug efflux system)